MRRRVAPVLGHRDDLSGPSGRPPRCAAPHPHEDHQVSASRNQINSTSSAAASFSYEAMLGVHATSDLFDQSDADARRFRETCPAYVAAAREWL